MWEKVDRNSSEELMAVDDILSSIENIQGKNYSDFVMLMFNTYSIGMAMLTHCLGDGSDKHRESFGIAFQSLRFLMVTMTMAGAANVARNRIIIADKKDNDPENIRMDIVRDFTALAKRLGLPYEAF